MKASSAARSAASAPAPRFSRGEAHGCAARLEDQPLGAIGEPGEAGEHADQPQVERHVAVQDVAELVAHHALQLVARELLQRAPRDDDHRLVRRVAGDERVDASSNSSR